MLNNVTFWMAFPQQQPVMWEEWGLPEEKVTPYETRTRNLQIQRKVEVWRRGHWAKGAQDSVIQGHIPMSGILSNMLNIIHLVLCNRYKVSYSQLAKQIY